MDLRYWMCRGEIELLTGLCATTYFVATPVTVVRTSFYIPRGFFSLPSSYLELF